MKERIVHYVEVGNVSSEKAKLKLKEVMNKFEKDDNIERYFISVKNGEPQMKIEEFDPKASLVFYIEVGNMAPKKAKDYIGNIRDSYVEKHGETNSLFIAMRNGIPQVKIEERKEK